MLKVNTNNDLKVGGKRYRFREYIGECPDDETLGGDINFEKLIIRLREDVANDVQVNVAIHEIIHAVFDFVGITGEHDEREVSLLANALHTVLVDNPGLFRWEGEING